MDNEKWVRDGRHWSEYPAGTKAKALMGGYWVKITNGKWLWPGGNAFPTPGGDATGEVCLPDTNNTQLPAEVLERIDLEAKQFAFSNYVHAGNNPEAKFEDVRTWPYAAQVSYFSIKNYLDSDSKCWLYKEPTIFTECATKLHQAGKDRQYAYEEMTKARSCFNDARTLLEKLVSNKHAFILPQQIENEIKTFLDGK
jgi:hypothetical protein